MALSELFTALVLMLLMKDPSVTKEEAVEVFCALEDADVAKFLASVPVGLNPQDQRRYVKDEAIKFYKHVVGHQEAPTWL